MHIMVRDKRTGTEDWIPLEQAAELLTMPVDELEGMLTEYGEYESADYVVLDQDW